MELKLYLNLVAVGAAVVGEACHMLVSQECNPDAPHCGILYSDNLGRKDLLTICDTMRNVLVSRMNA